MLNTASRLEWQLVSAEPAEMQHEESETCTVRGVKS